MENSIVHNSLPNLEDTVSGENTVSGTMAICSNSLTCLSRPSSLMLLLRLPLESRDSLELKNVKQCFGDSPREGAFLAVNDGLR